VAPRWRRAHIRFVFWLAYDTPEGVCVILQPASSLIHARLVAAMIHELF
jgi:hypothetical protein